MKKLAIIGASYLQEPLIKKAKEFGLETHVFAWECGDIGEKIADFFYPISIVEKELILEKCKEINIDGICTIASDLAVITVNYVANRMNLVGNSDECTLVSTNKYLMRQKFLECNDPSPKSILVESISDLDIEKLNYPVIVKPIDRSGSRGITKLENKNGLETAIYKAKNQGFEKKALVEEFVFGQEYSVEYITQNGFHNFLAITKKYTTGAPMFIETGHLQPSELDIRIIDKVKKIVEHALSTLKIVNGASHSEIKIDKDGNIKIIEIGGRMGGDFIGSNMVDISTGIDFVGAVIDVALGRKINLKPKHKGEAVAVRFIFSQKDIDVLKRVEKEHPEYIVAKEINELSGEVTDSASRHGFYLLRAPKVSDICNYLPGII